MIGETLGGRYHIVEKLGRGGMAEVYKAHQPGLDRYVAVKVLHTFLAQEKDFLERFQREARAVAALRHPNIVQVFDFAYDEERDIYYMVMEHIDGPNLKVKLQELAEREEVMSLEESIGVGIAVGEALDYAHQRGMVHRDIKPANVMFTSEGQAVLTDFGIARMVDVAGLTASGAMVGTPAYISPEQGMGEAGDERSDIYSLGVLLYQLFVGVLPFEADTAMGIVLKHINEPLPAPREVRPDLPVELEQVITRALVKRPEGRFQRASDLAGALRAYVNGEDIGSFALEATIVGSAARKPLTIAAPDVEAPVLDEEAEPAERRRGRRWLLPALTVVILASVIGAGYIFRDALVGLLTASVGPVQPTGDPSTPMPDMVATHTAATLQAIQATLGAPTRTPEPTNTPALTPDMTATTMAGCVFDSRVVYNPAVWPYVLAPGQRFTKRWELENSGTCTWPDTVALVFVSGDEMDVLDIPDMEPLSPGENIDIRLSVRAPTSYRTYTSQWQLQDGYGHPIGEPLEFAIRVGPTPSPVPATATTAPTIAPTASAPLWMSDPALTGECDGSPSGYHGGAVGWGVAGGSSDNYRFFYGGLLDGQELPTPYNEFRGFPHSQTYFTVIGSGGTLPTPSDCGRWAGWGDQGYCRTDSGYEVVWRNIYITEDMCQ